MKNEFFAHSKEGKPPEGWHRLEKHSENVAEMAHASTKDINTGNSAYLARPVG